MTADIARQLQALCRAVLMGGGLGVLYDLMRIVHAVRKEGGDTSSDAMDILVKLPHCVTTAIVNGIRLLDMRPVFVEYYNLHQELPYGSVNTRPGNGHLNKLGHRLIAEALIPYLEEAMA